MEHLASKRGNKGLHGPTGGIPARNDQENHVFLDQSKGERKGKQEKISPSSNMNLTPVSEWHHQTWPTHSSSRSVSQSVSALKFQDGHKRNALSRQKYCRVGVSYTPSQTMPFFRLLSDTKSLLSSERHNRRVVIVIKRKTKENRGSRCRSNFGSVVEGGEEKKKRGRSPHTPDAIKSC